MITFVLIHSPLVGLLTWSLVERELRARGQQVVVPRMLDDGSGGHGPFWQQEAESIAQALSDLPGDRRLVLVGHSGAGPLLPAIAAAVQQPVAGYIFVDAGIPAAGLSRLAQMEAEVPEWAAEFRRMLEAGGRFPEWSAEDLREVILDDRLRQELVGELQPRSLQFFLEPLPVFAGWPDAPCGYLLFSEAYTVPARQAREAGWAFRAQESGHFQMLVDPAAVSSALLDLAQEMGLDAGD